MCQKVTSHQIGHWWRPKHTADGCNAIFEQNKGKKQEHKNKLKGKATTPSTIREENKPEMQCTK